MESIENQNWYVVRVRFNRVTLAQAELARQSLVCYLPMQLKNVRIRGGKLQQKLVPILSNLIFVRATFEQINSLCKIHTYLSYISSPVDGLKRAIVVPDVQMRQFMEFIEGNYSNTEHKKLRFRGGQKIRITSGLFEGSEAIFRKVKGNTEVSYVVEIGGRIVEFSLGEDSQSTFEAIGSRDLQ